MRTIAAALLVAGALALTAGSITGAGSGAPTTSDGIWAISTPGSTHAGAGLSPRGGAVGARSRAERLGATAAAEHAAARAGQPAAEALGLDAEHGFVRVVLELRGSSSAALAGRIVLAGGLV